MEVGAPDSKEIVSGNVMIIGGFRTLIRGGKYIVGNIRDGFQ